METFHKLAGMTETDPSQLPDPPPIPQQDPYAVDNTDAHSQYSSKSRRESRASLPINRRPSHRSFRSRGTGSKRNSRVDLADGGGGGGEGVVPDVPPLPSATTQGQSTVGVGGGRRSRDSAGSGAGESEGEEDFVWGPSHPCFPHPNPHCAPGSEEAKNTRVIRVRRDWLQQGDLYPQYANIYPEILDPLVSDEDFRFLISNINARIKAALDPFSTRAWLDAFMGVATGFVWDDLGFTGAKKGVRELEGFIDQWNKRKVEEGKEVRLVQVRRTGFMSLDFVVPDPGIDVVGEDGGDGRDGGIGPAE